MILSAIRTEVRTRTGYAVLDTDLTDAILTALVNVALRDISLEADWPWLETETTAVTVADTETIALANNVRKVTHMRYQYRNLKHVQYRDRNLYYGISGPPAVFSEAASSYYIWPTADAVYTIDDGYVITTETALSADGDAPFIPDWAVGLLISRTCMLAARRRRDKELESVFYAEYQGNLSNAKDNIMQVTLGLRPKRIGNKGGLA
jgi:hypothetical protein